MNQLVRFWEWLMGHADHEAAAKRTPHIAEQLEASDRAIARADRTVSRALAEVRRLERHPR